MRIRVDGALKSAILSLNTNAQHTPKIIGHRIIVNRLIIHEK